MCDILAPIFDAQRSWLRRGHPWVRLIAFSITLVLATFQHWSAQDLAWSFWLTGLLLGLVYIPVSQVAEILRDGRGANQRPAALMGKAAAGMAGVFFVFLFAYAIFAGFLDTIFAFVAQDAGESVAPLFRVIPASIASAFAGRWSFLITSGISLLPVYVQDALTVEFTDFSKPIFARDMLRMIVLIFLLVALVLARLGPFALYVVLFVYFLPLGSLREIGDQIRELLGGRDRHVS